jgi:aspartate oxidase
VLGYVDGPGGHGPQAGIVDPAGQLPAIWFQQMDAPRPRRNRVHFDMFRAREAAAMTAHGRWMFHAALERTETRGMHKRLDYPQQDPAQQFCLLTGGLEDIWIRPEAGSGAFAATDGLAA